MGVLSSSTGGGKVAEGIDDGIIIALLLSPLNHDKKNLFDNMVHRAREKVVEDKSEKTQKNQYIYIYVYIYTKC